MQCNVTQTCIRHLRFQVMTERCNFSLCRQSKHSRWALSKEGGMAEKQRNLCEASHWNMRDWQTINTVIHREVVLIHLTSQLMETIWQANQGWFHVSREGGKVNASKMSAPIKCEWQPSVFHWWRIYNKPDGGVERSPFAHRRPGRRCVYLPQVFIVFYSSPPLCYRATLLQTLNNLWSGTWQSVTNYSTVATLSYAVAENSGPWRDNPLNKTKALCASNIKKRS